ncbi:hypothetical protein [Enterobacter sp. Bisph1]|uniref:hypothetical protein n=1 Tax=Enterobacter sp. Bisph1 TaxID=1274399 RepID=UPI00057BD3A9|nr:hypothetical protein [Enterobacter sp. Bisph1]
MKDAAIQWLSNPSIGSLIGIIGIFIAVLTYFLSRSTHRISVHKTTKELIGLSDSMLPEQVEVLYEGEKVNKLSSTSFILWNSGNKVITKNSLETIDPLRIKIENHAKILRYEIKTINNLTSNISIKPDEEGFFLKLLFDFLEKNNGFHLEILHTGKDSDIKVAGKVIGVKTPNSTFRSTFFSAIQETRIPFAKPTGLLFFIGFFGCMLGASFLWPEHFNNINKVSPDSFLWMIRSAILVNLVPFVLLFIFINRSYPSSLKDRVQSNNEKEVG